MLQKLRRCSRDRISVEGKISIMEVVGSSKNGNGLKSEKPQIK